MRELASRESEVVAFLVNNKSSKLPLTQKSRSWNIAFQQGIYEGVRRCEDLLRERPGPRNATTRDFMKSPERQAWNCERCGSEGATGSASGPSCCASCGEWPARMTLNGLRCHLCECRDIAAANPVPLPSNPEMLKDLASIGVLGAAQKLKTAAEAVAEIRKQYGARLAVIAD